ncbi:MAG: flagellin [Aromatoleum sp.]|jgi:flagellin|uniref:flagellin N-terminal helical domain-containing protein n=1 Tax=Aromatoleum sp. TaxID=2307007 RepID=UPI002894ADDD|nr:flagellin [Aromatoleum sp.]MDT3671880.1 flagellin [Aromatoleum sp.]
MLSLHTNAAALSTQNALGGTQKALTTSMSRLGTGFRINSAMDDAAGLQIATRLNAQSRGMAVAQRNTQNGISMLQTAEGALNEVSNMVLRMKDLATEAANGTTSASDRTALEAEFTELGNEITNIMTNTKFGGQVLLTGGKLAAAVNFQIGSAAVETYAFDASTQLGALDTAITALKGGDLDAAANAAITLAETTVDAIGTLRSKLGSGANRLDHVYNNLANIRTNTEQAKGRIMDVDYASETANMTTKQMLMQASTSMLKQSGSMSQLVMSLMQ